MTIKKKGSKKVQKVSVKDLHNTVVKEKAHKGSKKFNKVQLNIYLTTTIKISH